MNKYTTKICLVGLGPAGIGFVQEYIKHNLAHEVLVIEAGPEVESRSCEVLLNKLCNWKKSCNIITGFGGASLMAGGKLSIYPAGESMSDVVGSTEEVKKGIRESFLKYSANIKLSRNNSTSKDVENAKAKYKNKGFAYKHYDAFIYSQKDFFNLNLSFQKEFLDAQLNIKFNSKITNLERNEAGFLLEAIQNNDKFLIQADKVVLGVGRFGTDLVKRVVEKERGINEWNRLDIGIRLEFPKESFLEIDSVHNDLKLKFNGCKTFCVSKEGQVAVYLKDGILCTEGYHDLANPTSQSNLAIVYKLAPQHKNQEILQDIKNRIKKNGKGKLIRQSYLNLLGKKLSNKNILSTVVYRENGEISKCLPKGIYDKLLVSMKHFVETFIDIRYHQEINVFFPEINYGGPKFKLNNDFSLNSNLFIIGESTGKFLGILQSHFSGTFCARNLIINANQ